MLTYHNINYRKSAGDKGDSSFGNMLFKIAGVIGIAVKNGYDYGFEPWINQKYFKKPLPICTKKLKRVNVKPNFNGYDFGFRTFDYPDDRSLGGEFGDWRYFEHCEDLIKSYFDLRPLCEPFEDCILMHYRNYNNPEWVNLPKEYYMKALKMFPRKRTVVITDNVEAAYKVLGGCYEYSSNSPIIDFYLLCNTDYLVMANSTFSWWASYLSDAVTVAPSLWYDGKYKDAPKNHLYLPDWTII